jgi:hypothetical protein
MKLRALIVVALLAGCSVPPEPWQSVRAQEMCAPYGGATTFEAKCFAGCDAYHRVTAKCKNQYAEVEALFDIRKEPR